MSTRPSPFASPAIRPPTMSGVGVAVGGTEPMLARKLATVLAVVFRVFALNVGCVCPSAMPTAWPLKLTLGFEKYWIRGQKALHELWYAIIVAKALPAPMWPWLKVNGELSVGSWNQSCRAPMLW